MNVPRLTAASGTLALHLLALAVLFTLGAMPPKVETLEPVQVALISAEPAAAAPSAPVASVAATPAVEREPPKTAVEPEPPKPVVETAPPKPAPAPEPPKTAVARPPESQRAQRKPAPRPPIERPLPQREPRQVDPVTIPEPAPSPRESAPQVESAPAASPASPSSQEEGANAQVPTPAAAADTGATASPAAPAPQANAAPRKVGPRVDANWRGNTPPPYPAVARRMGDEGEVRIDVHVGTDGRVIDIRLRQSSGSAMLDRTAIDTVRRWRFTPATVDGQPVAAWYHDWRWVFRLDG